MNIAKIAVKFFQEKTAPVLIFMLFFVVFTRYQITFLNASQKQILPESVFAMDRVGRDWLDGVVFPMFTILGGRPFNPEIGYGRGIPSVLGLVILPLQSAGICTDAQIVDCASAMYKGMVVIVLIGFFSTVLFLPYGKNLVPAALVLIAFLLGMPGSLGLDRGNLDIIFSLFLFLGAIARFRQRRQTVFQTVAEAVLLALMANTKITIVPFVVVFLLTSTNIILFIGIFAAAFIGFSYLPMMFLVSASLWDSFYAASTVKRMFPDTLATWCAPWNHTIFSIASLATNCSRSTTGAITALGVVLFSSIIWPFIRLPFGRLKKIYEASPSGIFFLMLCLVTASINLLPYYAYAFRLYYSLICLLLGWYIVKEPVSRRALVLSSVFLLLKGLWIPENKIINIAVFFHFYYLIRAAVSMI